jgi:hypothetical protein
MKNVPNKTQNTRVRLASRKASHAVSKLGATARDLACSVTEWLQTDIGGPIAHQ